MKANTKIASGVDDEKPIVGEAYDRASQAALDHLGEGRVTETEEGDEDSDYEVEVTLDVRRGSVQTANGVPRRASRHSADRS